MVWKSVQKFPGSIFAEGGRLYLTAERLQNDATPLDGEWQFVWDDLHSPGSFPEDQAQIMSLPSIWNGYRYGETELPAHGIGTYQLEVVLKPGQTAENLAVYIPFIHSSYALYLQDKLVATDGKAGRSSEEYIPSARTQIIPLPNNPEIDPSGSQFCLFHGGSLSEPEDWQAGGGPKTLRPATGLRPFYYRRIVPDEHLPHRTVFSPSRDQVQPVFWPALFFPGGQKPLYRGGLFLHPLARSLL